MTYALNTTATLTFDAGKSFSQRRMASLLTHLMDELSLSGNKSCTETLSGVLLSGPELAGQLTLDTAHGETRLELKLRPSDTACGMPLDGIDAKLAEMAYILASRLTPRHVIWSDTEVRLPCDVFLAGLDAQFGGRRPARPAADAERVVPIRRRAYFAAPRRARPALSSNDHLSRALTNRLETPRYDAHIQAYEAQIRLAVTHVCDEEELAALREEYGIVPLDERVAEIAAQAPGKIYEVARSEPARAAAAVVLMAGVFLGLDTTGAMAAVTAAF
ncbi:hypothetical protein [Litorisediminicola beolgyonensis]|uniref:Uncharacterized protein n=1 Tax=Litorisediminicola beolgyonensis TaxID=1173614 RepID=A0ABW3ZFS7_9RHOB